MTLVQLEYIIAVYNQKSFSKAAEKCFVTQPTLSMQIQKLEEWLGVIIFDRSKKPVVPTEVGYEILDQARKVVKEGKLLQEIVEQKKGEVSGELRIGIIPTVAPYLVPLFLTDFLRLYPKIKLILNELTTDQITYQLRNDLLDAGILVTPLSDHHLKETALYYEPFVAYVSPKSSLYLQKLLHPKAMDLSEIWLLNEGHCMHSQVINLCYERAKKRINPNFEYKAGSIETLKKMVEINEGATLLPALALAGMDEQRKKMIRYFKTPEPVREISLVTHRNFIKRNMINALSACILENIPKEMQEIAGRNIIELNI